MYRERDNFLLVFLNIKQLFFLQRKGVSYLQATLSSLFDNLNEDRTINVKFVVFIAETDQEFVNLTISQISEQFEKQIENNILQVNLF